MYKLIIEDDEGKTTVVPLIRDEITIGRKEGNTIRLTERNVSRKHARLLRQNGHVYIEDIASYNGIKLNGDRIDGRAAVGEGDRIQIGDYQLALTLDKPAAAGTNGQTPNGHAETVVRSPAAAVHDEKTTPYLKDSGSSNVPTRLIDAPTIQTPAVPTRTDAVAPQGLARLVIVSSNFAGQEFLLDKAAVVIGRTDDNDVVVNHRSISRHHAKVVRENGHYHVVDLQSANGVRVNGEEYGKVELRRGDHVDLGHVRFRFVAPGEDFIFERDAQVVDVSGRRGTKSGFVVGIVLLALVGGGYTVWRFINPPAAAPTTTKADIDNQVFRLLAESDRAMKSEEWELAIAKCDEALKLDPTQELARDKKQRAEAERKNRAAYQRFMAAADKDNIDGAVAAYGEVSEDSTYRQRGAEAYARVKKDYVRVHLEDARKLKAAGSCDAMRQQLDAITMVDDGNAEVFELGKGCGAVAKAPPPHPAVERPRGERPEHVAKVEHAPRPAVTEPQARTPNESDTPPTPGVDPSAEKALADAQEAYVHGQYATAIDLAKKATRSQPTKAWRIIGACYCFLKDRNGAVTSFSRLDAQGKQFLKYVCSRAGITVP